MEEEQSTPQYHLPPNPEDAIELSSAEGSLPDNIIPSPSDTSSQHGHTGTDGSPRLDYNIALFNLPTIPSAATDANLTTSDITINNVSSTKHGFAPKSPADATQYLNGATTPAYAQVKDSDLSTSDITNNNVSTSKHGFVQKLPNDQTKFLNGLGNFTVPLISPNVYSTSTPVTVSNTTAKTALISFTLPGGTLGTTGGVWCRLYIYNFRFQGSSGVVFSASYGGTAFAISESLVMNNVSTYGVIDILLLGSGSTNAQTGTIELMATGDFPNYGTISMVHPANQTGTAAKDSTSDQTFEVDVQFSGAGTAANDKVTMQQAVVFQV